MAIREIGYRHWEGKYTSHSFRWWTVTKAALRSTVFSKGRLMLHLLLISVAWAYPFFSGLFWFFAPVEFRVAEVDNNTLDRPLRDDLYLMLQNWQWMWTVVFSAVIGSRLVSNDLRSEALYIYLAKPLRRIDYIIGKLLACVLWLLPITILPALWVFGAVNGATNKVITIAEPGEILFETLWVQFILIFVCAALAVTISSLTKRWMIALVGWIGAVFIGIAVAQIAAGASRNPEWLYLSPVNCLWIFAEHVYERPQNPRLTPDWEAAAWILHGLILLAVAVFVVRILKIEVSE